MFSQQHGCSRVITGDSCMAKPCIQAFHTKSFFRSKYRTVRITYYWVVKRLSQDTEGTANYTVANKGTNRKQQVEVTANHTACHIMLGKSRNISLISANESVRGMCNSGKQKVTKSYIPPEINMGVWDKVGFVDVQDDPFSSLWTVPLSWFWCSGWPL